MELTREEVGGREEKIGGREVRSDGGYKEEDR